MEPPTRSAFKKPRSREADLDEKKFSNNSGSIVRSAVCRDNDCGDVPRGTINLWFYPGKAERRHAPPGYGFRNTFQTILHKQC